MVPNKFILFPEFGDIKIGKGSPKHFRHFIIMVVVYFLVKKVHFFFFFFAQHKFYSMAEEESGNRVHRSTSKLHFFVVENLENLDKNKNIVQNSNYRDASKYSLLGFVNCTFYCMLTS